MRVAPVGLFPEWFDDEDAFELGMRTGAITCGHVPGGQLYGACQGFNEIHITGFTDWMSLMIFYGGLLDVYSLNSI